MTGACDLEALRALQAHLSELQAALKQLPAVQAGEIEPHQLPLLMSALEEPIVRSASALPPMERASCLVVTGRVRQPGAGRKPNRAREILASDVARAMDACELRVERTHGRGAEDASLYFQVLQAVMDIAFPPGSLGAETARSANYGRLVTSPRRWKIVMPSRNATLDEMCRHGINVRPPGQLKP